MVSSHENGSFALLCAEDNESILGFDDEDDCVVFEPKRSNIDVDFPLLEFPLLSDECIRVLVGSESECLPKKDYVERLRSGVLDISIRTEAVDWIWKVHKHFNFGPMSACLSINYLDRFLSVYVLPTGNAWITQLLSIVCLSLAAKMEETVFPYPQDLQVVDAKYIFEARTIQRMELVVLSTLKWRMQAATPFSFVDFFLHKFNGDNAPTRSAVSQSIELILRTARGIDFIEFRPSEIAAATALYVIREIQVVDVEQAMSVCVHVAKESVLKCFEAIKDMMSTKSRAGKNASRPAASVPESPIGVLEAACLSYNSTDDVNVGSNGTVHDGSPASKRRKKF